MHSQKVIPNQFTSIILCKWFSDAISEQVIVVIGFDDKLTFTITPTSAQVSYETAFFGLFLPKSGVFLW
jgi:hypothetical protein